MTTFPERGDNFKTIGGGSHDDLMRDVTIRAYQKLIDRAVKAGDTDKARELMLARDEIRKRRPHHEP